MKITIHVSSITIIYHETASVLLPPTSNSIVLRKFLHQILKHFRVHPKIHSASREISKLLASHCVDRVIIHATQIFLRFIPLPHSLVHIYITDIVSKQILAAGSCLTRNQQSTGSPLATTRVESHFSTTTWSTRTITSLPHETSPEMTGSS